MEYMEVFQGLVGDFEQERLFKFSDSSAGRLLALRPDITMPLARVAATKLAARQPLRMFYIGEAFQFSGAEAAAGMRKFTQIGVELMGQSGPMADAEVVALAINVLKEAGLRDFQIDVGQVQFFKGLMQEAGLTDEQAEEARGSVEEKNMLAIEMLMQRAGIGGALRNRIMELPALYGGPEDLDQAEGFSANSACRIVNYLRSMFAALSNYGLDEYAEHRPWHGAEHQLLFRRHLRGDVGRLGHQLLAGGRYDGLVEEFGRQLPATGFAFSLNPVPDRSGAAGGLPTGSGIDAAAAFSVADGPAPLLALGEMRASGLRVEQFYRPGRNSLPMPEKEKPGRRSAGNKGNLSN